MLQLIQGALMGGSRSSGSWYYWSSASTSRRCQNALTCSRCHIPADNLYLMMAISGVFAALRVAGAIGLMRDRM